MLQSRLEKSKSEDFPDSPVVRTSPANAEGAGLLPGGGAKIPHASGPKDQNIKQKQYWSKFNKGFKKWFTSKKKSKTRSKEQEWIQCISIILVRSGDSWGVLMTDKNSR